MEVKIKDRLWKNGQFGAIRNTEKITRRFSVESPNTTADTISYDVTEASRVNKLDFERKQAYSLVESQRMRCRII